MKTLWLGLAPRILSSSLCPSGRMAVPIPNISRRPKRVASSILWMLYTAMPFLSFFSSFSTFSPFFRCAEIICRRDSISCLDSSSFVRASVSSRMTFSLRRALSTFLSDLYFSICFLRSSLRIPDNLSSNRLIFKEYSPFKLFQQSRQFQQFRAHPVRCFSWHFDRLCLMK